MLILRSLVLGVILAMDKHSHIELEETVRRYELIDLKKDMAKGFKDVNAFMKDSNADSKNILETLSNINFNMAMFATKDEVRLSIKESQNYVLGEVEKSANSEDKKSKKEIRIEWIKSLTPVAVQLLLLLGTILTLRWK